MKRMALHMRLKSGRETEYLEAHKQVWPELIKAAHEAGIRNHSVFVRGSDLFVYIEAADVEAALAKLSSYPVKKRWDEWMFDLLDAEHPPVVLDEGFHMD